MIGQTIGNYRITSLLGEGGMGEVYLAEHPGIGRLAAVKVLHKDLARSEEMVQRFFNEARAANAIRHPGIVEIFDSGLLPWGAPYIVMELLEGESLRARLKRGRLHPADAVDLATQAADALAAAHAKGIVHRDLKPDNLFLVPGPVPGRDLIKILDFGIAKLGHGPRGEGSVRTRTGAVLGTPLYMSPEQCRGTRELDLRTDIYSLGVILYEMLCGQPPFVSEGFGEMAHLHISATPPPPRSHVPDLPPAVERAVLLMLEKEPEARFPSMRDVQQALRQSPVATMVLPPAGAPVRPRVPERAPGPATRAPNTTLAGSATAVSRPATVHSGPRWGRWVAVMLVAGAATGAWLFLDQPERRRREPVRLTVTSESVAEPTAPAPRLPDPALAPSAALAEPSAALAEPATVTVSISSTPPGARLVRERDGAILGMTPFEESWPAADGRARLRLEKDGYRPETFEVRLDRGLKLDRALREVAVAPPRVPRKSRSSATIASPPPQPEVKSAPPPPASPATAPPARKEPVKI